MESFRCGRLTTGEVDMAEIGEVYPYLRVHDAAAAIRFYEAVDAGATVVRPLENQFYGERSGMLRDPFGHEWLLGGHIEDVTPEEMQRRYTELMSRR